MEMWLSMFLRACNTDFLCHVCGRHLIAKWLLISKLRVFVIHSLCLEFTSSFSCLFRKVPEQCWVLAWKFLQTCFDYAKQSLTEYLTLISSAKAGLATWLGLLGWLPGWAGRLQGQAGVAGVRLGWPPGWAGWLPGLAELTGWLAGLGYLAGMAGSKGKLGWLPDWAGWLAGLGGLQGQPL